MNNHKTPTNGYLESGQKFPRLYIAAAFLYYYFFIIKAELGLQEIEKTLKLYLAYVTASLAPRVCLAYGYLLFSSVFIKIHGYASHRSNIYSKPVSHHWEDWRRLLPQRGELQQTQKSRETQILWNPLLETNCQVWIILKHLLSA